MAGGGEGGREGGGEGIPVKGEEIARDEDEARTRVLCGGEGGREGGREEGREVSNRVGRQDASER